MGMLTSQRSVCLKVTALVIFIITSAAANAQSAYELIEAFNLPKGLLPQGVTEYSLENETGKFSASFNGSCEFSLEGSYQLKYKSTIRGYIRNGQLSNLQGVSVKLFFFWADIVQVYRSGNSLEFSVGIASAGFPVDNFEESPRCGCGLDCAGRGRLRFTRSPLLT
uniref:Uncharacterized protein n=1 Tax=Kalanchoe fedtschenkoi TaxID=63787 RepID=A0A7N0T4G4_KALFE